MWEELFKPMSPVEKPFKDNLIILLSRLGFLIISFVLLSIFLFLFYCFISIKLIYILIFLIVYFIFSGSNDKNIGIRSSSWSGSYEVTDVLGLLERTKTREREHWNTLEREKHQRKHYKNAYRESRNSKSTITANSNDDSCLITIVSSIIILFFLWTIGWLIFVIKISCFIVFLSIVYSFIDERI